MIDKHDLERMLNLARTDLVGSSEAGLKAQLFEVCHEFFADSNAWQEHIKVPIVAGERNYVLIPQEGGMIIRLVAMWDTNHIALPAILPHFEPPNAKLLLVHAQNTNYTATAVVIKNVIRIHDNDTPDAPRWLMPVYERTILDGLLGKMMGQSTKPYSNETLSTYHLRRFRDGIMQARVAAERANLYGGQAWRFPGSFRTTSQRGGVSTPYPSEGGF